MEGRCGSCGSYKGHIEGRCRNCGGPFAPRVAMRTRDEIQRELDQLGEQDSNDTEICRLRDIIGELLDGSEGRGGIVNVNSPAARALRAIQRYDQTTVAIDQRLLLIEAETALGEVLGLECTGAVDGTNEDGSPAYYDHSGDTCPIHEWLVPSDYEGEGS